MIEMNRKRVIGFGFILCVFSYTGIVVARMGRCSSGRDAIRLDGSFGVEGVLLPRKQRHVSHLGIFFDRYS